MSLFAKLRSETHLPGFDGATGWLNSEPLTPEGLRGKVVLVDFWTYTCINWLRTLGYVRAWAEKYEDQGLVVVGVHTPEFPFERDVDNVRDAVREMRVEYPIALDSGYAVWEAFGNHYWPAILLSAGEPLPSSIGVHDYLTVDGRKLAKSFGTAVDPLDVIGLPNDRKRTQAVPTGGR